MGRGVGEEGSQVGEERHHQGRESGGKGARAGTATGTETGASIAHAADSLPTIRCRIPGMITMEGLEGECRVEQRRRLNPRQDFCKPRFMYDTPSTTLCSNHTDADHSGASLVPVVYSLPHGLTGMQQPCQVWC